MSNLVDPPRRAMIPVDLDDEWVDRLVVAKLLEHYRMQQHEVVRALMPSCEPSAYHLANATAACKYMSSLADVLNYFGHEYIGDVSVADAQSFINQFKETNESNKAKRRRRTPKS